MGADPRLPPRLSNDSEYVILSEHDYVAKSSLISCTSKMKAISIDGLLFDINKSKNLILSADIYSTSPDGYLAELYNIKTKRSAIQAKGLFNQKLSVKKQIKDTFSFIKNGIISKDGQYVSVNGKPDCTGDSYPGIYNIKTGKQINSSAMGGLDGNALDLACKEVFE